MNKISPAPDASIPRQTDIVIDPDGRVHISFLWHELSEVVAGLAGESGLTANLGSLAPTEHIEQSRYSHSVRLGTLPFPTAAYRSCRLCPKICGFNRARLTHPRCGDAALRVATYGLSRGDEPEIRGSRGSGAIMFGGCSLTCPSCHNPEMVAGGKSLSISELVDLCYRLLEQGAHNIQFLSPTVHFPALQVALTALKTADFPLPIVFKSSGYESLPQIQKFAGLVDVWLPDFKFGPNSAWAVRAGVADYFEVATQAILGMYELVGPKCLGPDGLLQRGVLVRHVMAPLPKDERQAIEQFLEDLPEGILVSFCHDFVDLEGLDRQTVVPREP